ncbi:MAG: hypothetical protein JWN43_1537, partial [Gammaproteobacteria bacterium]|nr:hypothetical protein [Gammaproteobacteria bacterium]
MIRGAIQLLSLTVLLCGAEPLACLGAQSRTAEKMTELDAWTAVPLMSP